jgi:23S rRNA (uridine2552-2'-O)-methyltransferase
MSRRDPRRQRDHFTRRAQRQGSPARSIFKLEEIDKRWRVLERGDLVVDLGCAPGSWLQYAARRVGADGRVLGFDLKSVEISLPPNATTAVADAFELTESDLPRRADVLLSDMAPATMGHHQTDALRSAALAEHALAVAERLLKPGGNVVVKVLEGGSVPEMVKEMRAAYLKVEQLRPKATRKRSSEIFLVGLGKKA